MKKIKTITIMLFMMLTTVSFSQISYDNNLTDNSLYLNLYAKLKSDKWISLLDSNKTLVFKEKENSLLSERDSIKERVFLITSIQGQYIQLQDTLTKDKFFYYKYGDNFPFLTSRIEGINYTTEEILKKHLEERSENRKKICQYTDIDKDEFEGTTTYSNGIDGISLIKVVSSTSKTYYLSLNTSSTYLSIGSGCIILFTDGTKMVKQTKVDSDYYSGEYQYSVFITLTQTELNVFKTKTIKGFKLYIYDEMIYIEDAKDFQSIVSCIVKN